MSIARLTFCVLIAVFICAAGCGTPKPPPNPLAGWTFRPFDKYLVARDRHHYQLDKAIADDYQNFISDKKLFPYYPPDTITGFYEDGTGQHAIQTTIPQNGTWLVYVLIYDQSNARIKVIKYANGHYRC